jgi:hypothetical protein
MAKETFVEGWSSIVVAGTEGCSERSKATALVKLWKSQPSIEIKPVLYFEGTEFIQPNPLEFGENRCKLVFSFTSTDCRLLIAASTIPNFSTPGRFG